MGELSTAMRLEELFSAAFVINLKRRQDRISEFWDDWDKHSGCPEGFVKRWNAFDNPTNGHAGCTRSHRELLALIAHSTADRVLIMEDDSSIITQEVLYEAGFRPGARVWNTWHSAQGSNLNERFDFLSAHLPDKWDVLYIGGGYGEPPISRYNKHVLRVGFIQTTSCYGVTREFARKFSVELNQKGNFDWHPGPIDNTIGGFAKDNLFYCLQPRLTYQRNSFSDIAGTSNSYLNSMTDPVHENMV